MSNINNIKVHLKNRMNDYKDYEIVVTLLALVKDNKINEKDVLPILEFIYDSDMVRIYNALNQANTIVNDDLIDEILKED